MSQTEVLKLGTCRECGGETSKVNERGTCREHGGETSKEHVGNAEEK